MTTTQQIRGRGQPIARKSSIVDQHGRPVSYYLYPSPRANPKAYKPRGWTSPDTRVNVSAHDRAEMVNYARQLFAQIDVLSAAVNQKNNWAFGDAWDAHYFGKNEAWGETVQEWLNNQWMPNCNIRGPQYSFKRSLLLSGIAWDVDGDDVMVLTKSSGGFPQLAFFPGTKISNGVKFAARGKSEDRVKGGEFDGAKIFDGIIYDRNSRPVGIRIMGEGEEFTDVSTYNADLAYEPQWADQGRGFPKIATSLLRWMDLQDIDSFLQKGVKRAASVGLIVKNEEGEAPMGNEIITGELNPDPTRETYDGDTADQKVAVEELAGGETYYFSSAANESIEALDFKNPHPNTEAFIERLTRGCLASIGWYAELMDLTSTGRAPSRILCDLANQSVWSRQRTGYRRWKRAVNYAVALGMKSGIIPKNSDGIDAYRWEPGMPKPITVDAGNEAAADREAFKLGLTSRSIIVQKWHGMHYKNVDRQRSNELRETIREASKISKEYPEVSFDRALELLEQRSPNPIVTEQQGQPDPQQTGSMNDGPAKPTGRQLVVQLPAPTKMRFIRDEDGQIISSEPITE